jgi:adenylate cyclase
VIDDGWRAMADGAAARDVRQGYLAAGPDLAIRVRLAGEAGTLTIKGASAGPIRGEWEYSIPAADVGELLALCSLAPIEKTRWIVPHGGRRWEVDEFHGANAGLVLAECELPDPDADLLIPPWAGREVTDDERYYNAYLARYPFADWG